MKTEGLLRALDEGLEVGYVTTTREDTEARLAEYQQTNPVWLWGPVVHNDWGAGEWAWYGIVQR